MINDVVFGRSSYKIKSCPFYVYQNFSGNAIINKEYDGGDWLEVQIQIAAILSHETLHKVLLKLEGARASRSLDKWCRSRRWIYNDDSGICFFASELEDSN